MKQYIRVTQKQLIVSTLVLTVYSEAVHVTQKKFVKQYMSHKKNFVKEYVSHKNNCY